MATLLEVIQAVALRTAIPKPATVIGSTDPQVLQLYTLLEEGCEDISQRGAWERLTFQATHTTLAAESQGTLESLCPKGFRFFKPETFWDRTEKLPLLGPGSAREWQFLKAIVVTGPRYTFRIRGGEFISTPAPPAGHEWVFEYVTENWILAVDGTTYKSAFTADTDQILLPEQIIKADLRWRWKKEKGLAYVEDFNSAERLIVNALGRDGGKPVLKMDDHGEGSPQPGIFVPSGSWLQ